MKGHEQAQRRPTTDRRRQAGTRVRERRHASRHGAEHRVGRHHAGVCSVANHRQDRAFVPHLRRQGLGVVVRWWPIAAHHDPGSVGELLVALGLPGVEDARALRNGSCGRVAVVAVVVVGDHVKHVVGRRRGARPAVGREPGGGGEDQQAPVFVDAAADSVGVLARPLQHVAPVAVGVHVQPAVVLEHGPHADGVAQVVDHGVEPRRDHTLVRLDGQRLTTRLRRRNRGR